MSLVWRLLFIFVVGFVSVSEAQRKIQRHEAGDVIQLKSGERYVLKKELGAGAYGTVFSAGPLGPGETIAIKFYSGPTRELSIFKSILEGFKRAQNLNHPSLIPFEIWELSDGETVVKMPLAEKRLSYFLRENLTDAERLQIALEVFSALKPLLQSLVVHNLNYGDIKPENIVRVNGEWKLIDFDGLDELGLRKQIATAYYSPSEVRTAKATHWTSDAFSVGRTISKILLGDQMTDDIVKSEEWSKITLKDISKYYPEFSQSKYQELRQFIAASLAHQTEVRGERLQRLGLGNACNKIYN